MSDNTSSIGSQTHNETLEIDMAGGPTREEIDAKLALGEARVETALARLDGKMDILLNEVRHVGATAERAERAASNIKWNVFFTALGTVGVVVAVIIAMWAVGYQIADLIVHPGVLPARP